MDHGNLVWSADGFALQTADLASHPVDLPLGCAESVQDRHLAAAQRVFRLRRLAQVIIQIDELQAARQGMGGSQDLLGVAVVALQQRAAPYNY